MASLYPINSVYKPMTTMRVWFITPMTTYNNHKVKRVYGVIMVKIALVKASQNHRFSQSEPDPKNHHPTNLSDLPGVSMGCTMRFSSGGQFSNSSASSDRRALAISTCSNCRSQAFPQAQGSYGCYGRTGTNYGNACGISDVCLEI